MEIRIPVMIPASRRGSTDALSAAPRGSSVGAGTTSITSLASGPAPPPSAAGGGVANRSCRNPATEALPADAVSRVTPAGDATSAP